MSEPILRPARVGDYDALYGERPRFSMVAYTAEIDGRVVGIGGIGYRRGGKPVLFSRMTAELRPHKKFIVRCLRIAADLARNADAAAIAEPTEPLSCKLLQRVGLTWVGTHDDGEVFAWR